MGARDNSMPEVNNDNNNDDNSNDNYNNDNVNFQCKSDDIEKSASLFENNETQNKTNANETKHNVCNYSLREKLYSKYLEAENIMKQSSAQIKQSSKEKIKSEPSVEIAEEHDSVMTSTQFQVQSIHEAQPFDNIEIHQKEKEKEEGETTPTRVNRISVIKLSGKPNNSTLQGKICDSDVTLLIDTGATMSCISEELFYKIRNTHRLSTCNRSVAIEGVDGKPLDILGEISVELKMQDSNFTINVMVIKKLSYDFILGRDFLNQFICIFDIFEGKFVLVPKTNNSSDYTPSDSIFPFPDVEDPRKVMNNTENEETSHSVHAPISFILPPQSETILAGKLDDDLRPNTTGIITARNDLLEQ